eukprot:CAMPEP_0172444122 /NCGR_PEP_ID=MMETSP1065-20121228/4222_1 /TAXON_ID=265537 /ORGANISM="Amphiprora paludosa, Strain CCMP125" /LENGTH=839 /DNA_ID=CAMNT_0013194543 /DNA_START=35 /DNA_END=2554 /DNA_ORIENTATION=+
MASHGDDDSKSTTSSAAGSPNRRRRRRKTASELKQQHQHPQQPSHPPSLKSVVLGGDCSVASTSTSTSSIAELGASGGSQAPTTLGRIASGTGGMESSSPPMVVVPNVWGDEAQLLDEALNDVTRRRVVSVLGESTSSSTTGLRPSQQSSCGPPEDEALRHMAVDHVQKLLDKWTPRPSAGKAPSNPWNRTRPTLITFGSYRLGVHRHDSDLDVLALCPPEFSRGEFFSSWIDLLKQDKSISKVHPIPGAYTPVIKFLFRSKIHVDMLFARVADGSKLRKYQETRPPPSVMAASKDKKPRVEYKIDDSDLKEQDEAGVRSLNGARVSQMLLEMVPDLEKYRKVLRAVKEWAVAKGIYSNVLGFLGGVNFAILVAWICRGHPDEDAPGLLKLFFRVFSEWSWPTPVKLLPLQSLPPEGAPLMPSWDPQQNPRDRFHIMPIITPAYPSMNSTYNVGIPQLRRMQEELMRASMVLSSSPLPPPVAVKEGEEHNLGAGPEVAHSSSKSHSKNPFAKLFEKSDFFARHANFLQIKIEASNEQQFLEWFRLVESRLRLLIGNLETQEIHVWPYAHFFDRGYDADGNFLKNGEKSPPEGKHESLLFIGLRFARGLEDVNLNLLTSDFVHKLNSWDGRRDGMNLHLSHVLARDLPLFVRPAKKTKQELARQQREFMQEFYYSTHLPMLGVQKENMGANFQNHQGGRRHRHNNRRKGGQTFHNPNNGNSRRLHHPHNKSTDRQQQDKTESDIQRTDSAGTTETSQASSTTSTGDGDQLSAFSSSERAETEETQSIGSDGSFGSSSSTECGEGPRNFDRDRKNSPMKRICVYTENDTKDATDDKNDGTE